MDEVKLDAELAAKFNGRKVRVVDDRGAVVGYYLPAADYAAGIPPSLPPEPPPTDEEIAAIFAQPIDPANPGRRWEDIRADWMKRK